MIKYLFIVINSLAVFIYSLFIGENGITVTGTIPSTLVAGQEVPIEIKITKGSMAGFAKFQLEVPEGIEVKEAENKAANYTYKDGIAKWVWASLPAENDLTIKITLITSTEDLGAKTIRGKFSYVEDNAKQVVEMTPAEVTVIAPGAAVPTNTTLPAATETQVATLALPDTTSKPAPAITPASNNEPPGNINVIRTISKGAGNEYIVNLKIKKGATKGFARYSDDLPEGLIVKANKTDGSSFSLGDGKLKFVWVNVPQKENLELEYAISSNSSTTVIMTGEYSYLEDNQSKNFTLSPEKIDLIVSQIVDPPKEEKTEAPANNNTSTQGKMEETLSKKEGAVNYHVQIGAFTNAKVEATRLKKIFKISESISSEMQGGFSKFMVGSHGDYKEARDHREVMKNNNGIKSSFVVAYNSGKRITVQEALMITSQKWYK